MNKRVALLVGASSEIGQDLLQACTKDGAWQKVLVGENLSGDLLPEDTIFLKIFWGEFENHLDTIATAITKLGSVDLLILSTGYISNTQTQNSVEEIGRNVLGNYQNPIYILTRLITSGLITDNSRVIGVSSALAGNPPRMKNYVYSASKSAFDLHFMAIALDSGNLGKYLLVRPGYIPTKINRHLAPGFLPTTTKRVATHCRRVFPRYQKFKIIYSPRYIVIFVFLLRILPKKLLFQK